MIIVTLADVHEVETAMVLVILFAVVTLGWFFKIDARSVERTGTYFKVGRVPLTHHIPEMVTAYFFGQMMQVVLGSLGVSPIWLVLILVLFSVFVYTFAGRFVRSTGVTLPAERKIWKPLAMTAIDVFILVGYFTILVV